MNHSDSFQNIFPILLENITQEVGDLIGESLRLQEENISHGSLQKIFSPPKKKFVLTGLTLKDNDHDPAHLLVDMDMALDLGGKLIMLPENEINTYRKRGKLDGEILDAFSEIVNIITGVVNSTCQEYIPRKKLNFVKGEPEVFTSKATAFPFPETSHSLFSGTLFPENGKPGIFQLFFPHTLLEEQQDGIPEKIESETDDGQADFEEPGVGASSTDKSGIPDRVDSPDPIADVAIGTKSPLPQSDIKDVQPPEPERAQEDPAEVSVMTPDAEKVLDQKIADVFLLEGLEAARDELEALLGDTLRFIEQQTNYYHKKNLLVRTKGKQVLARIGISGDKEGEAYLLVPLKDAILIGATLLLMPPETVTQTIKQGKFEGEVADAFGEIVNILVGCYSNRFRTDFPVKLALRKETVETLVPAQVNPDSNQVFGVDDFYVISTRMQLEDKVLGPLEMFFPIDVLGLAPGTNENAPVEEKLIDEKPVISGQEQADFSEESRSPVKDSNSQPVFGQNFDTDVHVDGQGILPKKVVVLGRESEQVEELQEILGEENVEMDLLSPDSHLRQQLDYEKLCCVFLFLKKVNEQGFAEIIKIRAVLKMECPLIVAGPEWTRSKVLKAVQYGATDVMIIPAEKNSIRRKCHKYLEAV